jgi:hypothetical protein
MTYARQSTARRFPETQSLPEMHDRMMAAAVEARMVSQIADAIYGILITDESDPADQATKRAQVTEAARAAWCSFAALP